MSGRNTRKRGLSINKFAECKMPFMRNIPSWSYPVGAVLIASTLIMVLNLKTLKANAWQIFQTYTSTFIEESYCSIHYRLGMPAHVKDRKGHDKYPLIIYLHGGASRGSDNKKQILWLNFLGNGISYQARAFHKNYPCYVYVPQCPHGSEWEGEMLDNVVNTIEHLLANYPIDPQRLYLVGYSMGGSGVYALAERYYDTLGHYFAGIVRIAGQNAFSKRVHRIVSNSSVWLHIGLQDAPLRVERAREAFAALQRINDGPPVRIQELMLRGQPAKITSLLIDHVEKYKITEYPTLGHGIPQIPFENPDLLIWLFNQKTKGKNEIDR